MNQEEEKEIFKLTRKFGNDYVEEIRGKDQKELNSKLLELAKYRQSVIYTRNNDMELAKAKAEHDRLKKPYQDDLKNNLERQRLVTLIMKEQGFLEDQFLSKDEQDGEE